MTFPARLKSAELGSGEVQIPAPDPEVMALAEQYVSGRSFLLDAGTGIGRNAIELAARGHTVIATDTSEEYLNQAMTFAELKSIRHNRDALDVSFIKSDITTPPNFEESNFDAVFCNRVIQELDSRDAAHQALEVIQDLTVPGGQNIVTAYIGSQREQETLPHLVILNTGELEEFYLSSGWDVVHAQQNVKPLQSWQGELICRSHVDLVATKPE